MRNHYLKQWMLLCAMLITSSIAFAQTGSITGKVFDETNQPMPAATVVVQGTPKSTSTDINGSYKLTGLKNGTLTLEFRFLGYVTVTRVVELNGTATVSVTLKPNTKSLNEVVVIGYGTARKKDLTGSVTTITSKDFNQGPVTTPEQLIQGKVAGVQITSNSGAPGAGSTIRIRGGASLNITNDPLIIVDGVPISNYGVAGTANALSMINPNDIESFNILKDASATAIYGSRASNGVIIITTKKGSSSKLKVDVSSLNSVGIKAGEVNVLSADQFRTAVTTYASASQAALMGKASTNWQDQIYQNAFTTDNNITLSGGIKSLPYRLSVGYLNQDGILKTSSLKRTSLGLALGHDFLDNSLRVDVNLKGTYSESRFANEGAIGSAVTFDPTQPVYSGNSKYNGYYEWLDSNGNPNTLAPRNPLGLLMDNHNLGYSQRSIGNIQLGYRFPFLKDLKFTANLGYDVSTGSGSDLIPAIAAASYFQKGSLTRYYQDNINYLADYYLNYTNDLKSINTHVDFTAGYTYQYFQTYNSPEQGYAADGATTIGALSTPSRYEYYIESPFARLNFTVADKYIITATMRDDRTSRFSDLHKNGYFPSVALAWRINQESFLKDSKFLSDLKLRASYGVTGQQDIGQGNVFPYLARYTLSNSSAAYQFGNSFVNTLRSEAYNEDIKWEETSTYNIGLDYGFLNGAITGTFDVYKKKTKDLLADVSIADGSNLTNHLFSNIGNLEIKGMEFAVNAIPVSTKDFKWNLGFNISYDERTLTSLSKTNNPDAMQLVGGIGGGVGNTIQVDKVGVAPNAFYVYQQVYGANGAPLEGIYVDVNKNGSFDVGDKYAYKQPDPKVFMGFNSLFDYKKFSLGFSMRANLGNYVYNNVASGNGSYNNFKFTGYLANAEAGVLKTNYTSYQYFSDYYVENASFLRMDNANLSYNFGKICKGKANLRVTANVSNVFVITNYTGLDPEVNGGIDNNFYPRARVYSIGINLGL